MTRYLAIATLFAAPLVWVGAVEYLSYVAFLWPFALLVVLGLLVSFTVWIREHRHPPAVAQVEVVVALGVGMSLWTLEGLVSLPLLALALVVMALPNRGWALWPLLVATAAAVMVVSQHPVHHHSYSGPPHRPWLPSTHGIVLSVLVLVYAIENRLRLLHEPSRSDP